MRWRAAQARGVAVVAAIVLAAWSPVARGSDPAVYGKGVGVGETVTVADLLVRPDAYVDQVVRVEGVVTAVCPETGRWIDISTERGTRTVRFEVKHGEIVFPLEVKGRRIVAEGTFRRLEPGAEEAADPDSAVTFKIEGTGAVIH